MDPLHQLRRFHRRPTYKKLRSDPSTYLNTARLHLLKALPANHRLYSRATDTGALKSEVPPNPPRTAFTEEELRGIRTRRRHAEDPDDVRYQLYDSKLIEMWNADYEREEQWREYDQARPVMEVKREMASLPDAVFDPDDVVGEKRKRALSADYRPRSRQKLSHDVIKEEEALEDGELVESDEMENKQIGEQSLKTLREMNDRLRLANASMRAIMDGSTVEGSSLPILSLASPPDSPPRSETTDISDCDSDDSSKAVCGDDNRPDPIHISSWLGNLKSDAEEQEEALMSQGRDTAVIPSKGAG